MTGAWRGRSRPGAWRLALAWLALAASAAAAPLPPADPAALAARQVLERSLGPAAARIELHRQPGGAGAWYQVRARDGGLRVDGSGAVALAHGAYAHLNRIGAASVSWEGTRAALPARYADYRGTPVAAAFDHRAYLNTCTYGYTTPFWDWPRWEKEIDWMALHGIDMPLALEGQEAVWQALWREFGVPAQELDGYFSGPAFAPWQRMGNIEGYRAPLPQAWIARKQALQKRILARMRALGMTPVLPAFAGYVPKAFALAHPQARIYRMRAWEGFHETYWLDPTDPLFARVAQRFLALYTAAYGPGDHYLADAFNEMLPPVAGDGSDVQHAAYGDSTANTAAARARAVPAAQRDARLAAYGEAIYRSIQAARPGATWVMQGWLFGADRAFWQPAAVAAFLSRVPDTRMLVLDIGNDRYPGIWQATHGFDGKRWIYGYVHNYGGSNPVYGDLGGYRDDVAALLADPQRGRLAGFGVFPEGLHSNSLVYAYLYGLAWEGPAPPLHDWVAQYTRARYGRTDAALQAAWTDLEAALYRTRYWSPRWWNRRAGAYLLFKRPTAGIVEAEAAPGDPARLRRAIDALLAQAPGYADAPLYRYDLVEYTRHYLGLRVDALLQQVVRAYAHGDFAAGDRDRATAAALVRGLDALVGGQQQTLADWTGEAAAYADAPALKRYYVANARAQVSVWGGEGNLADYASKAWQGMYAGFYLPRWQRFLTAYRAARQAGRPFDEAAVVDDIARWERRWVDSDAVPARVPPADAVADIRTLLARLDRP